jgi:hypothetical protein
MGKAPAFQFYPGDWLSDPQLRLASASTKGIWIDLLCYMWKANDRGKLHGTMFQLCRMTGSTEEEMTQFINEANFLKFADVTICNNELTVCNRRMLREERDRKNGCLRVQKHRMKRQCNENVTPPSSSSSSSSVTKVTYSAESGMFINIQKDDLERWSKAYPAISLQNEISKAESWVKANPKNKKSNWERFLNNWFSRAQDKAPPLKEVVFARNKEPTYIKCPACGREILPSDREGAGCIKCMKPKINVREMLKEHGVNL